MDTRPKLVMPHPSRSDGGKLRRTSLWRGPIGSLFSSRRDGLAPCVSDHLTDLRERSHAMSVVLEQGPHGGQRISHLRSGFDPTVRGSRITLYDEIQRKIHALHFPRASRRRSGLARPSQQVSPRSSIRAFELACGWRLLVERYLVTSDSYRDPSCQEVLRALLLPAQR